MKFFNGGARPQSLKPASLTQLADNILIAMQAYDQRLAEVDADKQDALNKLTYKGSAPAVKWIEGDPAVITSESAAQMQSELEAIAKP